ncbi:MAG: CRTAC1 family protein [Gemmatimonadota bacterium]|nr:CRTAC1 family protein [Gemmatimonadota bacterium]
MRIRTAFVGILSLVACDAPDPTVVELTLPPEVAEIDWLVARASEQLAAAPAFGVNTGFSFTDRRVESGITFVNHVVDDAGRTAKAVHYDHGNGVAAADVDGDGLADLYFSNQVGANSLWKNLGEGRFEDITEVAGVGLEDRIGVAGSFADIDNDGDADLFATSTRGGNALFENDGSGGFRDITVSAGVAYSGHSSSAEFFDFDRDGLLDLFVVNVGRFTSDVSAPAGETQYYVGLTDAFRGHLHEDRTEVSRLYRNLGDGRFEDVTEAVGLVDERWSGEATAVDMNEDGWPDLYVLSMQGPDGYWENVGGTRFVERSVELFEATPWGAMGIQTLDWNNDGTLEFFITDMHSDMWEVEDVRRFLPTIGEELRPRPESVLPVDVLGTTRVSVFGNALLQRTPGGRFVDIAPDVGLETYWPWGSSAGDLNADGWMDLVVTASMNFPFRYTPNGVLLNDEGRRFRRAEFIVGVEPRRDARVEIPWFSLDCRERDRESPLCATGAADEVRVSAAIGSRSSILLDLDGDGDLDIVTNDFNSEPMVLVSDLAAQPGGLRYLEVVLEGVASNRDGLGAIVTIDVADRRFVQLHDGQSGYLSQSLLPLYFGLGEADSVDRLEVRWPSGEIQVIDGPIPSNQRLRVREEG